MKSLAWTMVAAIIATASSARAATCTLNQAILIQSLDSYYCDSNYQSNCSTAWFEWDLDINDRPMRFMRIEVTTTGYGHLASATTGNGGIFSATWTQASCSGSVFVFAFFERIHESDNPNSNPRLRFRIAPHDGSASYVQAWSVPLTGATTNAASKIYQRTAGDPDVATKVANLYYSTNSGVSEIINWHTDIKNHFTATSANAIQIRWEATHNAGCGNCTEFEDRAIEIEDIAYNKGERVRHELGHTSYHSLQPPRDSACYSSSFGNGGGHGQTSCEWGSKAYDEGMAQFLATRSITIADTNAWHCWCGYNANQDECSETAAAGTTAVDGDRIVKCDTTHDGYFSGIGDTWASARTHCSRVKAEDGCRVCNTGSACSDCSDFDGDGACDNYQSLGFRNEINVARFLWDMVDFSDEGGDDTDESMASLATVIHNITCVAGDFGNDGTCNEPDQPCIPSSTIGDAIIPAFATRDSLNPWDLGDKLLKDQSQERSTNCVDGATD